MQLHNYQDHKKLENKIFSYIVDEIIDFNINGITIITINVNNKEQKVLFRLMFIVIGDNLGLNTIFGFSKVLNSQYYCRVCTVTKKNAQNSVYEEKKILEHEMQRCQFRKRNSL